MMNLNIFGVGAAGNKAAIECIERGIIPENCVKLINTTTKDIPEKYKINKNLIVQFSSMLGGCGKEPEKGDRAMTEAITEGKIDLGSMITDDCREIVLVTSTEGGTGCGATPVLAKYFELVNIPVHVFAFVGFQDEARGINNTLKFFKRLSNNVILHTIMNDQFIDFTGNYERAESMANAEFANQIKTLIGSKMIPSSQNIDDTDLYKATTTPGYMDIKNISLTGVKNIDTFNEAIIKAFENGNCLEYDRSCKRLAIIVNASERIQESIDSKLEVIKRYTGEPYEVFRHIQNNDIDSDEYIDIITSGMNFPEKGIIDISKKYMKLKNDLNKGRTGFDDIFANIDLDDADEDEFNVDLKKKNDNAKAMFANAIKKQTSINNVVQPKSRNVDSEY